MPGGDIWLFGLILILTQSKNETGAESLILFFYFIFLKTAVAPDVLS